MQHEAVDLVAGQLALQRVEAEFLQDVVDAGGVLALGRQRA